MVVPHFEPVHIWGDNTETTVYAQGYGGEKTVTFSFSLDKEKPNTSLANRICTRFHELEVDGVDTSYPDNESMFMAIWGAVRHVWPQCFEHPDLSKPDAVVDIDNSSEGLVWRVYHHPLFGRYVQHLADEELGKTPAAPDAAVVGFRTLIFYEHLGGRGCATRVRVRGDPLDKSYVFKGIDLLTFLAGYDDDGDKLIRNLIRNWHNTESLLLAMPTHPNILRPPVALVTLRFPDDSATPVICGTLQPFYPGGSVADRIKDSNKKGKRLPLEVKAHWCANMAAAVAHTHRVAQTYHMDIKPGNFLICDNDNLLLCDWEQSDGPPTTLAPEVDGTWDVSEGEDESCPRPRLRYTKYKAPPSQDAGLDPFNELTWLERNVFPNWNLEHRWALELAEVFSLGRSIWMVLRQPNMDFEGIEHPADMDGIIDWGNSEDIPTSWKQMVDRCMLRDPNERPDVLELARFWENEWHNLVATDSKG